MYPSKATPAEKILVAKLAGLNWLSPPANGRPNRFFSFSIVVLNSMINPGAQTNSLYGPVQVTSTKRDDPQQRHQHWGFCLLRLQ